MAFIAVEKDGEFFSLSENLGKKHSILLFEKIENLLNNCGLKIEDIDLLGTGTGPGSFTGIRVAVSTARALAQTLKKPLVGVLSHELYAASIMETGTATLIGFDAKKSRVFGGVFVKTPGNELKALLPPGDYSPEEIIDSIPAGESVFTVGDGYQKHIEAFTEAAKEKKIKLSEKSDFELSGEMSCRLVLKKFLESRETYKDLNNTRPFYARKSDAETARENR